MVRTKPGKRRVSARRGRAGEKGDLFSILQLVSVAEGSGRLVDEGALVDALKTGIIAGAGLDVYEQEPAIHSGLAQLKQVVLLPHLGSATLHARVQMGLICLENIQAVFGGRPAPNHVR